MAWVGGVWVAGASRLVGVTGCRARGEAGGVVRDDDDPDLGRGEARASSGGFRLVVWLVRRARWGLTLHGVAGRGGAWQGGAGRGGARQGGAGQGRYVLEGAVVA